ncbi:hypothetical protein [Streptomyces sp. NBC_00005]|uniref:hypothetical protein n=1 Tax=Streptomyces sp. NBC_00005 TaxID=2903609 RepID=UPI003249A1A6
MAASELVGWHRTGWRLLVAADVCLVSVFAVTATLDPEHVLRMFGVDVQSFQGLIPSVVVLVLRVAVWVAERRLLAVPLTRNVLLASRLASLIAFYYMGRWLHEEAYRRWQDVLMGGTLGYALVGVAGAGAAAAVHGLVGLRAVGQGAPPPPETTAGPATATVADPAPSAPSAPPAASAATQRRELTRESLFGLVGAFLGVAGLAMSVNSVAQIGVSVAVAAAAVALIAYLLRSRSD